MTNAIKGRLLALQSLLLEYTDDAHPLTMKEIISRLKAQGFSAERKSLYNDIELLKLSGMDIDYGVNGYRVTSRTFELAELKLLVDSVQASQLITQKKTEGLIAKLGKLCSRYEAHALRCQVHIPGRVKHTNERVYYTVDAIHRAIDEDKQLSFQYFNHLPNRQESLRRDGERYLVCPCALCLDRENYYLLARESDSRELRHYRVDRMRNALVENESRGLAPEEIPNMAAFTKKVFGMFHGEERTVELRFANELADVVFDRFGMNAIFSPDGPEHFTICTEVAVSDQFFSWLFGLGNRAQLLGPPDVVQEMKTLLQEVDRLYP